MKIAILGGTFDPIHAGHMQMAFTALNTLGADKVWLMPAGKTPLKERKLTSKKDRLAMCKLAAANYENIEVCTLELERKGKSYTIDTLIELKKRYPEHEFIWLIGNDQLQQFDSWKGADQLVELARFVCFDRDGKMDESIYDIECIKMDPVPVSSTQIRQGKKLEYLEKNVLDYIYKNRLYIYDFVSSRMNERRYLHSLSVASLCQSFACSNGYDENKAYLIGLFHDVAKAMDINKQKEWIEQNAPQYISDAPACWHGPVGAGVVRDEFLIEDETIYNAIYHHVHGSSKDPYAMMVFAADKLDPLRGYDSAKSIEACLLNIESGFEKVYQENRAYLKEKEII
jgi:nicotinate-nucleotide adenylyltransferase